MLSLLEQASAIAQAAPHVAVASDETRSKVLRDVAEALRAQSERLLEANERDLTVYVDQGAGRDRLTLTLARVEAMASALEAIAAQDDPLGEVVHDDYRPSGIHVQKIRVPLGVIGVVYENRPNVTSDVAGLCIKSGNAAFLRGSSSAAQSNAVLAEIWHEALEANGLPGAAVSVVQDTSHETVVAFMQLTDVLDCLIPRGGPSLIAAMREHARVPYVLDGDGNCHTFVDASADLDMAVSIVTNAKTSRPGVCNALETLLVHQDVASAFLTRLDAAIPSVEIRGDAATAAVIARTIPASEEDYAREFLDLILAVKVVANLEEAIAHVATYGTGHSEAIITSSDQNADQWVRRVDAAAVVVNASTRFIDGGELGLGGEVGISTQKLHARGPMGLQELTCLKWVVRGEGQIR
jgi:glutamate-5-semialdehyde dehydrogenase